MDDIVNRYSRENINHYNIQQLNELSRQNLGNKSKVEVPELKELVDELITLADRIGATSVMYGYMHHYPLVWCGIPKISRSKLIEQLKQDDYDDEDIGYELSEFDEYLSVHKYERVWLRGSVIRYIGENTNEIVAYVDRIGTLIDVKSGVPSIYLEKDVSQDVMDLKLAEARLAFELVIEQFKLLERNIEQYYSELDIPWIYRLSKASQEYLASVDERYESTTSKLDKDIGDYFIKHKDAFLDEYEGVELSLEQYLDYCRIAVKCGLGKHFDDNLSSLESYKRYSDGREGGLLDLFDQSPEQFLSWYRGAERQGCHPFEIISGITLSSAMHLYPSEKNGKFTLTLRFGDQNYCYDKLVLAAVALHKEGVMVEVPEASAIVEELLGRAKVGIFPYGQWHNPSFPNWDDTKVSTWVSADMLPLDTVDQSKLVLAPLSHRF